jgi:chromate reductase, NAD(P)H dehydrogenase (quinone)
MARPEAYIGHADRLSAADGRLTNDGTDNFLKAFPDAFDKWVAANGRG